MSSISNEEFIRRNKIVIIDEDGNTKLHYSAATGNVVELQEEIASGQRLDAENFLGWTPLMMAVRRNQESAAKVLLQMGANASKENRFGFNVFLMSVMTGNLQLITTILDHLLCGGVSRLRLEKTISPLSLAILMGHDHIFKYFLNQSFNLNATSPITGITPLMFAASTGNRKAIKKLLAKNADTTIKNKLGRTYQDIVSIKATSLYIDNVVIEDNSTKSIPMILVNSPQDPTLTMPYHYLNNNIARRSSDIISPYMFVSPNITPVPLPTPVFNYDGNNHPQQIFFARDFSPSQFVSPMGGVYNTSDMLNARINQGVYTSQF